jgi:hypothetical protein
MIQQLPKTSPLSDHGASSSRPRMCAAVLCLVIISLATSASAATLQDLFNGTTLTAGNARFGGFQLVSFSATGTPVPDFSLITVSPLINDLTNPGLQFSGNGQLATTGMNSLDLVLKFHVAAVAGSHSLTGHTLQMTGITFSGASGTSYISDDLSAGTPGDLSSAIAIADHQSNFFQFVGTSTFAGKSQILVTTDAFLNGLLATDGISLTSFTQRFAQTGAPGLLGDYNQDGKVDAADYVIWRNNSGTLNVLPNDAFGGVIGPSQYNQWRSHFGQSAGTGSDLGPVAVPEPVAGSMAVVAILAICFRRALRQQRGQ